MAKTPAPIVHFEIGCKDLKKTQTFYKNLLGWDYGPPSEQMAMLSNIGPMAEPKTDGISGHLSSLGHEPHQYVTVYAMVDDIDATLKEAEELGGKTIIPKQEVPQMGWFAWFADPEGNIIGLWKSMSK